MAIRAFLTDVAAEAPEVLKGEVEVVLVGAAATACVDVELPAEASVAVLTLAAVAIAEVSAPVLPLEVVAFAEATSPETVTFSIQLSIDLWILSSKTYDRRRQVMACINAERFEVYAGFGQDRLVYCFAAHSLSNMTSTPACSATVGIASNAHLPHVSIATTFAWVHRQAVVSHVCRYGLLAIVKGKERNRSRLWRSV